MMISKLARELDSFVVPVAVVASVGFVEFTMKCIAACTMF